VDAQLFRVGDLRFERCGHEIRVHAHLIRRAIDAQRRLVRVKFPPVRFGIGGDGNLRPMVLAAEAAWSPAIFKTGDLVRFPFTCGSIVRFRGHRHRPEQTG